MGNRYLYEVPSEASKSAFEAGLPIVLFRVSTEGGFAGYTDRLSDALRAAAEVSYDSGQWVAVHRRRGEDGPWVKIRIVAVTTCNCDPETPDVLGAEEAS